MTPGEFAILVGADPAWIRNTRRMLQRPGRGDEYDALWLSLVHELNRELGIALLDAARIAHDALTADDSLSCIEVAANRARTLIVTIDLARVRSLQALRCARVLYLAAPEPRGRPATGYRPMLEALERRARRDNDVQALRLNARRSAVERLGGIGPFADIIDGLMKARVRFIVIGETAGALFGALRRPMSVDLIHDASDEASLRSLAMYLLHHGAAPRGALCSEPIALDAHLLSAAGTLALDTPLGALNLIVQLDPIGDYRAALDHTLDHRRQPALDDSAREFDFPVLALAAQMAVQRHGGRRENRELLFELQELERERAREARRLSRRIRRP